MKKEGPNLSPLSLSNLMLFNSQVGPPAPTKRIIFASLADRSIRYKLFFSSYVHLSASRFGSSLCALLHHLFLFLIICYRHRFMRALHQYYNQFLTHRSINYNKFLQVLEVCSYYTLPCSCSFFLLCSPLLSSALLCSPLFFSFSPSLFHL